ncbi:MAG: hypothetical protein EXS09_08260 [Gemmataceae bacterium]|nr:hypothetical protein [Gemmataceae bacterium]
MNHLPHTGITAMITCIRNASIGFALLAVLLSGCNSKKIIKVHGKLLKDGQAMVVSEDTYVTLSFVAEVTTGSAATSHSAKFDQKTGTYTADLPAGKYRTMVAIALPSKKPGVLNAPTKPSKSETIHELTKDQELDIQVP